MGRAKRQQEAGPTEDAPTKKQKYFQWPEELIVRVRQQCPNRKGTRAVRCFVAHIVCRFETQFNKAVEKGGEADWLQNLEKATTSGILDAMGGESSGVTYLHIKTRLQKERLRHRPLSNAPKESKKSKGKTSKDNSYDCLEPPGNPPHLARCMHLPRPACPFAGEQMSTQSWPPVVLWAEAAAGARVGPQRHEHTQWSVGRLMLGPRRSCRTCGMGRGAEQSIMPGRERGLAPDARAAPVAWVVEPSRASYLAERHA